MGDKSRIVAVGFSDDITSIPSDKLQSFAAYVDGVFGIDTTDRVKAAEQYYRKKLNEILQQMC